MTHRRTSTSSGYPFYYLWRVLLQVRSICTQNIRWSCIPLMLFTMHFFRSYIYARFLSSALWSKFMERRGKETFLDKGEPGRAIWDVLLAPGGSKEPLDQCRDLGLHLLPWGDHHSSPRGWSPTIDQGGLERLIKG